MLNFVIKQQTVFKNCDEVSEFVVTLSVPAKMSIQIFRTKTVHIKYRAI